MSLVTFPRLIHQNGGSDLLYLMGPGLVAGNELLGRHIPNRAVRPFSIVFPRPRFNDKLGFLQGHKPVLVKHSSQNVPLKLSIKRSAPASLAE